VSPLELAIDAAAFVWVLWRQWRLRRVRLHFGGRVPVFLALFGLAQFFHFTETHALGTAATGIALGSCVVGGALFGALRGLTVRITPLGKGAAQQAGLLTIALWLVSVAAHLALGAAVGAVHGDTGVMAATGLLYLACTLGVQNAVVHRRAVRFLMTGGAPVRDGFLDARSWEAQA
jgi:hypothetical protein